MRKLVFNIRPRRVHKINYKHKNSIETLENKVQINGMTRKEYRDRMKIGTQIKKSKDNEEGDKKEEEKKEERIDKKLIKEFKEDRDWEIRNKENIRKISEDRERKIAEEINDEKLENKESDMITEKDKKKKEDRETGFPGISYIDEMINLNQKIAPRKYKDPGRMTIPCRIAHLKFHTALIDTGAAVNLLPLSIAQLLGLGEGEQTQMKVSFADQTVRKATGILKNVFVQLDKYLFLADFVTLDIPVNEFAPLILGRPFLATIGAIIDTRRGTLTMEIEDETLIFELFSAGSRFEFFHNLPTKICDSTEDERSEEGSYTSDGLLDPNFLKPLIKPYNFDLNPPTTNDLIYQNVNTRRNYDDMIEPTGWGD